MSLKRKYDATSSTLASTSSREGDSIHTSGSASSESHSESQSEKEKTHTDLTKRKKKRVNFGGGVTVYYFQRKQGFVCVPSQGGITLGMTEKHSSIKKFSLQEFSAQQAVTHRSVLKEQMIALRLASGQGQGEQHLSPAALQEIDKEVEAVDLTECYFLQPIPTKKRRLLLQQSGIKVAGSEKRECKMIQGSREVCGCNCKDYCDPESCTCSLDGIKCQVDRLAFPCCCTKDKCGNLAGRIEFNPAKVRSHYVHTIMKLSMEKQEQHLHSAPGLDSYQEQQQQQQHRQPTIEIEATGGPALIDNSRVHVMAQPRGLDNGSLPCVLRYGSLGAGCQPQPDPIAAATSRHEEDSLSSVESSCSSETVGGGGDCYAYDGLGLGYAQPPAAGESEPESAMASFTDLINSDPADLNNSNSLVHTLSTFGQLSRKEAAGLSEDTFGYADKLFSDSHLKALVAVPVPEGSTCGMTFELQGQSQSQQPPAHLTTSSPYFGCHSESSNQSSSSATSESASEAAHAPNITTLTSLDSDQTNFGEAIKNSILETVSV